MKTCSCCQQSKDSSLFYKASANKDGLANQCRDCKSAKNRAYAKANPEVYVKARVKYLAANAAKHKENCRRWDLENKERRLEIGRNYAKNNPEAICMKVAKRRAAKYQSTPMALTDVDKLHIRCIYQLAQMRTKESGQEWHVDHIVPLRNKKVCGLHTPWNLQVIPKMENLKKKNTFVVA